MSLEQTKKPKTDGLMLYVTVFVLGLGIVALALWTLNQKPIVEESKNQQAMASASISLTMNISEKEIAASVTDTQKDRSRFMSVNECRRQGRESSSCKNDKGVFSPFYHREQIEQINHRAISAGTYGPLAKDLDMEPLTGLLESNKDPLQRMYKEVAGSAIFLNGMLLIKLTPEMVSASLAYVYGYRGKIINPVGEYYDRRCKIRELLFPSFERSILVMHFDEDPMVLFNAEPFIVSEKEDKIGRLMYMSPDLGSGLTKGKVALLAFEDVVTSNDESFKLVMQWIRGDVYARGAIVPEIFSFVAYKRPTRDDAMAEVQVSMNRVVASDGRIVKPISSAGDKIALDGHWMQYAGIAIDLFDIMKFLVSFA